MIKYECCTPPCRCPPAKPTTLLIDHNVKLWALGPVSGGRALMTAVAPEITLPDRDGNPFRLGSLKGTKVFMCAWASW